MNNIENSKIKPGDYVHIIYQRIDGETAHDTGNIIEIPIDANACVHFIRRNGKPAIAMNCIAIEKI